MKLEHLFESDHAIDEYRGALISRYHQLTTRGADPTRDEFDDIVKHIETYGADDYDNAVTRLRHEYSEGADMIMDQIKQHLFDLVGRQS